MLETKHQWWPDTCAEVNKLDRKQRVLPKDDKFPVFAEALERVIANQLKFGSQVLSNQRVDRKMPQCAFVGSDQALCKVAITGFDPSNVNRESKAPHALQILAKIDPEVSRQSPKILRPSADLVLDLDVAACMDNKVTVTTVLSTEMATAWWEHGRAPSHLQKYMKDGTLTMSSGGKDIQLTLMPYLNPEWSEDHMWKLRALIRRSNGENDASWKNNVAITFMLDLWHIAGYSKQQVETLLLGQLRHQGVPAMSVHIQASRIVETTRGKRMLPVVWWSADTIIVLRTVDSRKDKSYASIWVGSIPTAGDSDMAYSHPSFSLRVKLEIPRKPGDKSTFDKSLANSSGRELTQAQVVRVSLPSARPSLSDWVRRDVAERDFLIDEVTSELNEALRETLTKTGTTVWDTCQGTAQLGGWWMPSTRAGFLSRSEAIVVAKDSMACQALVVMLKNSQQPRDDDGPAYNFSLCSTMRVEIGFQMAGRTPPSPLEWQLSTLRSMCCLTSPKTAYKSRLRWRPRLLMG
jgi:hypothetical protein